MSDFSDIFVGDYIDITNDNITNGTIVIAGFNVYEENRILFAYKNCLKNRYISTFIVEESERYTYYNSPIRTFLNNEFKIMLQDDIECKIEMTMNYMIDNVTEQCDYIWIPNPFNVYGAAALTLNENDMYCTYIKPYYENELKYNTTHYPIYMHSTHFRKKQFGSKDGVYVSQLFKNFNQYHITNILNCIYVIYDNIDHPYSPYVKSIIINNITAPFIMYICPHFCI